MQATGGKRPLAQSMGNQVPLVWAKDSRVGEPEANHDVLSGGVGGGWLSLLFDLQVAGQTTAIILGTKWGHCLPTQGVCEQSPPAAPVTSEVGKKEGTATEHHPFWSCSPGNTPALLLPLPNT